MNTLMVVLLTALLSLTLLTTTVTSMLTVRSSIDLTIDKERSMAYYCYISADGKNLYLQSATLPPSSYEITYGDIETIESAAPNNIRSCSVTVLNDPSGGEDYVVVAYDYRVGVSRLVYYKYREVGDSTWSSRRNSATFPCLEGQPDVWIVSLKGDLFSFCTDTFGVVAARYNFTSMFEQGAINVNNGHSPSIYYSLDVRVQDDVVRAKYAFAGSDSNNNGYYFYEHDGVQKSIRFNIPQLFEFYSSIQYAAGSEPISWGPVIFAKEHSNNVIYHSPIDVSMIGPLPPFPTKRIIVDSDPTQDTSEYLYDNSSQKIQSYYSTIDNELLGDTWFIARRHETSNLLQLISYDANNIDPSTYASITFNSVMFTGTESTSNNAIKFRIDESTEKFFILLPNSDRNAPIIFETALCTNDNDCSCSHNCDSSGYCIPTSDPVQRCEDPQLRHCRYQDQICYQCINDDQCDDYCDPSTFSCVKCYDSVEHCSANQVCNNGTCVASVTCSDTTPCEEGVCSNGDCIDCIEDEDCDGDFVCDVDTCVQCIIDDDCEGDFVCDVDTCVECLIDDDCAQEELCTNKKCLASCNTTDDCQGSLLCLENSVCVECILDTDCTDNVLTICSELNECVQCVDDDDCDTGVCSGQNECVQCVDHVDCDTGVCSGQNECVQCVDENDCEQGVCSDQNECVECVNNNDCSDGTCSEQNECILEGPSSSPENNFILILVIVLASVGFVLILVVTGVVVKTQCLGDD